MSGMFASTVKRVAAVPQPASPVSDPSVVQQTADADAQRRRQLAASGRASGMLTGGLGDTSTPMTASQTLLGG